MSNKPILPNAYVDINNRNLGNTPATLSGIFCFVGIGIGGSGTAETILSVGNVNEVASKIGYGELADSLIEFFNNGGRKAYGWRVEPTTEAVIGVVTKTPIGSSTGTIAIAKDGSNLVTNGFDVKIEITKTGDDGVAKFKYSTDGGQNYSPELVVPVATTYVITGTNLKLTFTKGAGAVYWEDGDVFECTVDDPEITNAKVESAVDAFIASSNTFDGIIVSVPADASLAGSIATKMTNAEAKPNFRYCYSMVRPALSTSAGQAVTQATTLMTSVANDRVQVVTGEAVLNRSNQADYRDKNVIGIIAGRRSSLGISEDVGVVAKGQFFGRAGQTRPLKTLTDFGRSRFASLKDWRDITRQTGICQTLFQTLKRTRGVWFWTRRQTLRACPRFPLSKSKSTRPTSKVRHRHFRTQFRTV